MGSNDNKARILYIVGAIGSLLIILGLGSLFPASEQDINNHTVFWAKNGGEYDRGLFNQFYISFLFAAVVLLLGYYVNSTFIRHGIKNWGFFAVGMWLMFLYSLARIGEITFSKEFFGILKAIILPFALIAIAYSSYKISEEFRGNK
jgi:hypothetical protein